ncbi:hypothetical protein AB4Z38_06920 [Arthrobacter sp. 2RAF6]|uniref:hypothetical protein n=1 Tax=Arthrobacter sp. 2RAF6 TaxID=3233002 RepID=UPI003F91CE79
MKEITITCTWRSTHVVEVEDDFDVPDNLSDFPEEVLEELTTDVAELVDWE